MAKRGFFTGDSLRHHMYTMRHQASGGEGLANWARAGSSCVRSLDWIVLYYWQRGMIVEGWELVLPCLVGLAGGRIKYVLSYTPSGAAQLDSPA